eukprot:1178692-Prorocentrum_minimum.AAC.2
MALFLSQYAFIIQITRCEYPLPECGRSCRNCFFRRFSVLCALASASVVSRFAKRVRLSLCANLAILLRAGGSVWTYVPTFRVLTLLDWDVRARWFGDLGRHFPWPCWLLAGTYVPIDFHGRVRRIPVHLPIGRSRSSAFERRGQITLRDFYRMGRKKGRDHAQFSLSASNSSSEVVPDPRPRAKR